ncbi:hypothetical protein BJX70DRAFT_374157 [Aspergillus crustosus]
MPLGKLPGTSVAMAVAILYGAEWAIALLAAIFFVYSFQMANNTRGEVKTWTKAYSIC